MKLFSNTQDGSTEPFLHLPIVVMVLNSKSYPLGLPHQIWPIACCSFTYPCLADAAIFRIASSSLEHVGQ